MVQSARRELWSVVMFGVAALTVVGEVGVVERGWLGNEGM